MLFVSFSVFLLSFLHRRELVGLTNSVRSGCGDFIWSLQPSRYQGAWFEAFLSQLIHKVKSLESDPTNRLIFKAQDTEAVGTDSECSVFGPWSPQGCGWIYGAHVPLFLPQVFRIKTVKGLLGRQRRAGWKTRLHFPRSWG